MKILYANHRGERRERTVVPVRIRFRASKYHMGTQWIMDALDCEDGMKEKDFALCGLDPAWRIAEYVFPGDSPEPQQRSLLDDGRPT